MARRHQPRDEKHPFESPTTPGEYVAFRNLIIELVCTNVNPKIGPRFWEDPKYWAPKYKREVRGVANLGKQIDTTDPIVQRALIDTIVKYRIKALVAKKTVEKVIKLTNRRIKEITTRREASSSRPAATQVDVPKNSTFVDTGEDSILAKIKRIENGSKKG